MQRSVFTFLSILLVASTPALAQTAPAPTATTLSVMSGGNAVTTVPAGSVVTLTASVSAGSGALTRGQVNFCDASASVCTDIHLLGMAQITSAGTATLKFRPAIGSHSYKAVFLGTKSYAGNSSINKALSVTGTGRTFPTFSSISKAGSWGNYSLTATVTETGSSISPIGAVSFLDATNGNTLLGSATLGAGTSGFSLVAQQSITGISGSGIEIIGDFNGDGIPDVGFCGGGQVTVFLGNGDGTFRNGPVTPVTRAVGTSGVVADFNGDGIQDLALGYTDSTYGGENLAILLGKGDGSFTLAPSPTLGTNSFGVASGDFNGDGIVDLALAQLNVSAITVLLGNGDGTFTTSSVNLSSDISADQVVTGDFNNDGTQDLIIDSFGARAILLPGNGDGTFGVPSASTGAYLSGKISVGDLNSDGKLDLLICSGQASPALILFGNGDGTFSVTALGVSTTSQTSVAAIGDYNGDGIVDVAVEPLTSNSNNQTILFLGKGDGTFTQAAVSFALGVGVSSPAVDLNGDGLTDFAQISVLTGMSGLLMEPTQTSTATVTGIAPPPAGQHLVGVSYAGDSNYITSKSGTTSIWGQPPTTTTALAITAGASSVTTVNAGTVVALTATIMAGGSPLTIGQVNFCDSSASSCTDIHLIGTAALSANGTAVYKFVPGPGQHNYKATLLTNSGGVTSSSTIVTLTVNPLPSVVYPTSTSISQTGSVGNYTLTATVTEAGLATPITGNISFQDTSYANSVLASAPLSSNPGLAWNISASLPVSSYSDMLAVGDLNGDGIRDVIGVNASNKTINILLGKGDGIFTTGTAITVATSPSGIVAGDFNGDGKADLALSLANVTYNQPGFVQIYLGNGDGTFNSVSATSTTATTSAIFAAADFNGDGKIDLALNESSNIRILLGNGDGTFTQGPATGITVSGANGTLAVGDLNGDGVPDLLVGGYSGQAFQVCLGNGDGTFRANGQALSITSTAGPIAGVIGDFNGDGFPDFSVIGGYFGIATVFLGKGDGTFTQASVNSNLVGIYSPESMAAADLNHDGKLDLVITNGNSSIGSSQDAATIILLGDGNGSFSQRLVDTQLQQTQQVITADVDGDGTQDLVVGTPSGASILKTLQTQTATATATGVSAIGPAPHQVVANYPGDSNYGASNSATTSLDVQVAAPVFTQPSGAYTAIPSLSITDATPGAVIRYFFVSGTSATGPGDPYTGPIPIYTSGTATVQAFATATGYQNSATTMATYTFTLSPAPAPVFSVASGFYPDTQTVTITDSQPGVLIYYTTNGQTPGQANLYTGPVTISTTSTLTAFAVAGGFSASPLTVAQYFIGSSSDSYIYTIAGNNSLGYGGDGGSATVASLNTPNFATLDTIGNVYIADTNNSVVRKVDATTGIITTVAGTGIPGNSGDGGPATAGRLSRPSSLAFDASGNLYIADSGFDVVRKVAAGSGTITTYAGSYTATTMGDNGPATSALLDNPQALAVDSAGNLYIGTFGRVRKVAAGTGIITTVVGTGSPSSTGDNGLATRATVYQPYGLAVDSGGNLYIADNGVTANVVRKVTVSSGVITAVAGVVYTQSGFPPLTRFSGDGGLATSAHLYAPSGVAVDGAGNVFIADTSNNVIRKVAAASGIITTIAGTNPSCTSQSGDGGPALQSGVCAPQSVALDSAGNLYIANRTQNRIRKMTVSAPTPATATATPVFSVTPGTYPASQVVSITDTNPNAAIYITLDGSDPTSAQPGGYYGPIQVAGSVTIKVLAVAPGQRPSPIVTAAYTITSPPTAAISTVMGTGTSGTSGSGSVATNQQLQNAHGVSSDNSGNLYVTDTMQAVVWKVSPDGTSKIVAGILGAPGVPVDGVAATSTGLNGPTYAVADGAGNLYIADSSNGVVRKVSAQTGIITTYAGNGALGTSASGDGGPATAVALSSPQGLALDSTGDLYIADYGHSAIRMVTPAGIISTVAGTFASGGYTGDGGPATVARLSSPHYIALDGQNNLYIGDGAGAHIRVVSASTGIITTIAGNGNLGQSGDSGLGTAAEINVEGLAVDTGGNLYFSNWPNTVRRIPVSGGVVTTVAGNGYTSFSGDGGSATIASLSSPTGIAVDASGNLFVADLGNYRVRKITFSPATATPVFSVAAGVYTSAQTVAITDSTPSATIFYTTDGSTPTTTSTTYTGPITVSSTETLQAIAISNGLPQSYVAYASYVFQAKPTITWATPAAITYGTALSATQLNASASVTGTFVYSPAIGAVLNAGQQMLSVTFTPTDTAHYSTATSSVTLTVNKATPVITWATPSAITVGSQLSATQLNATASVPGTFVYSPAAGAIPVLGSNTLSTTFTPTDAMDYNTATGTVMLTVNVAPNPVPAISSITPGFVTAGSAAFTLTVKGAGFINGSTIYWGATALTTTYVSAAQLTAQIPAGNVTAAGTVAITVQTAVPGGGTSNALQFEVDPVSTGTGPSISNATATVTAGSTATYAVTSPSNASNVSVTCLNLPAGATCSYSSSTGAVSIVTSSSTPKGTYQVTVVFTETLTVTTGFLLPFLLLPAAMKRRRNQAPQTTRRIGSTMFVGLLLLGFAAAMAGCGGGTSSTPTKTTTTTTQQVTSSSAVNLTVQ